MKRVTGAVLGGLVLVGGALALAGWWVLGMPGRSFRGEVPPPDEAQQERMQRLHAHVEALAGGIGARNLDRPEALEASVAYLRGTLEGYGYTVQEQVFEVSGRPARNLWVELPGDPGAPCLVIGAHYDSCHETPGADDNASGVAGMLELARDWQGSAGLLGVRLVAFVNEEPPYFQTEKMGSLVLARQWRREGLEIAGMISLEMLGDFRDEPGSQQYPAGLGMLFPPQGDFWAFIGPLGARSWVRRVLGAFRRRGKIPSEGIAAPPGVPGMDLSDHWSFGQEGYPALMITDGGPFRNHRYHQLSDTPETLDYHRMALGLEALGLALDELRGPPSGGPPQ